MRDKLILILLSLLTLTSAAQPSDTTRVFTEQNPLVYEDAWDLWPYVFLNEDGEAVGYNIDLLKLIFNELDIPYIIKLKPTQAALNDLKEGKADLMCGMDAHFHNNYARYGETVIQIFTHSILHRKGEPARVKELNDLSRQQVMVHQGSFSYHLMIQQGWRKNALPYEDMKEAVQLAHSKPGSEVLWNTMSLKWLVQTMHYDNLELSPVNMPHGEYKFMANNVRLLHQLDSVYTVLNSEGKLEAIKNKWFYPERKDSGIPVWIWQVVGILLLIIAVALIYLWVYRRLERRMTHEIRRSNSRLANILRTSGVRIWVVHVPTKTISHLNNQGRVVDSDISMSSFFQHLQPSDIKRVLKALTDIAGRKQQQVTLDVVAKDEEGAFRRNLSIAISVLRSNKKGMPVDIIGTTSDVTAEHVRQLQVKDSMLRYQSIFQSAMVDTITYDAEGYMTDLNDKASSAFPGGKEGALKNRVNLRDVLGDDLPPLEKLEPMHLTRLYKAQVDDRVFNNEIHQQKMYYEIQLMPIRNAEGQLKTIFGTGRDVTEMVHSYHRLQQNAQQLEKANKALQEYVSNINFVLTNGGVLMVNYSPIHHTLTIYSKIGEIQHQLTQARTLNLTDKASKHTAQHLLNSMDNLTNSTLTGSIKTLLRNKEGQRVSVYFSFVPTLDEEGQVVDYFGMCRDITEIKMAEELLAQETAKAQEVELVKNAFLRNMSYEIRTPLNSVVGFAELFTMEHSAEDENFFINEIKDNSAHLLRLINDILFLSRLDAHMIEFKQEPVDFAMFFEPRCQAAWANTHHKEVEFMVDNPYQRLVIDVDVQNLGIVIDQIVANAAEHTKEGQVRIFYDYTGEELAIAFQDTGSGISDEQMQQIFERFGSLSGKGTGLGLPICHEIAHQMGGKIRIKSEVGKGTIVWVTIPCKCSEIVRN